MKFFVYFSITKKRHSQFGVEKNVSSYHYIHACKSNDILIYDYYCGLITKYFNYWNKNSMFYLYKNVSKIESVNILSVIGEIQKKI